jgi:hypothetical protein
MAAERVPQGGGLTAYDPLIAAQGYLRDPRAAYNAYGKRQAQGFLGRFSGQLKGITPLRAGLAGGALAAVPSLLEGRPAEAVGGFAGSTLGAVAGSAIGSAILPGVGTVLGGVAGSALGGMLGGGAAEAAVSAYTGKPPTGQLGEEVQQPPRFVDTPLGRINLNSSASIEDEMNRNQKRQLDYYGTMMGMSTNNMKDLTQNAMEVEIQGQKAMLPITTKLANDQLTRAQALINTQNNAYMQQMTLGTQSSLALGAQRERGATMRQVLATNPYTVALAAPNISVG